MKTFGPYTGQSGFGQSKTESIAELGFERTPRIDIIGQEWCTVASITTVSNKSVEFNINPTFSSSQIRVVMRFWEQQLSVSTIDFEIVTDDKIKLHGVVVNGLAVLTVHWTNKGQFTSYAWGDTLLARIKGLKAVHELHSMFIDNMGDPTNQPFRYLHVVNDGIYFRTAYQCTIPANVWHMGHIVIPVKAVQDSVSPKLLATTKGTASAAIDVSGANLLVVVAKNNYVGITTATVPVAALSNNVETVHLAGGYRASGLYSNYDCRMTLTTFTGRDAYTNGIDRAGETQWFVYGVLQYSVSQAQGAFRPANGWSVQSGKVMRAGDCVTMWLDVIAGTSANKNTGVTFATMPAEFAPREQDLELPVLGFTTTSYPVSFWVRITTKGEIKIKQYVLPSNTVIGQIKSCCTYLRI